MRNVADLFCGGGGTGTAISQVFAARGERVHCVNVNHDVNAIATSRANHPTWDHYCAPIDGVTPSQVVPGRYLDLLAASPQCTGYSTNVSGRAVSAEERALCWSVMPWVSQLKVQHLFIENVKGFMKAGPLDERNRPIKAREGEEFSAFIAALRVYFRTVEWRIVNAANFGDPQERERLFILANRDDTPIAWPEATHGGVTPWRTARDIIEWPNRGGTVKSKRKLLAKYTFDMIDKGLEEFNGEPFLVPRRQGTNRFVRGIDRPLMTVVATRPCIALVQVRNGVLHHRQLTLTEYLRSQSFPDNYKLVAPTRDLKERLIGNAVPINTARAHIDALVPRWN